MTGEQLPSPERRFTPAQEQALKDICERYKVGYSPDHYFVYPADSFMMAGWAEGFVGGAAIQETTPTIYIGVSPEGDRHS